MEEARTHAHADRHERGFRKIAWAFLKVIIVVHLYHCYTVFLKFSY